MDDEERAAASAAAEPVDEDETMEDELVLPHRVSCPVVLPWAEDGDFTLEAGFMPACQPFVWLVVQPNGEACAAWQPGAFAETTKSPRRRSSEFRNPHEEAIALRMRVAREEARRRRLLEEQGPTCRGAPVVVQIGITEKPARTPHSAPPPRVDPQLTPVGPSCCCLQSGGWRWRAGGPARCAAAASPSSAS